MNESPQMLSQDERRLQYEQRIADLQMLLYDPHFCHLSHKIIPRIEAFQRRLQKLTDGSIVCSDCKRFCNQQCQLSNL